MGATLLTTIERWSRSRPDEPAVRCCRPATVQDTTWAELAGLSRLAAESCREVVGDADRVALVLASRVESIAVLVGLWAAGVDTLLLEPANSYLADRGSQVHRAGCCWVVGDEGTPDGLGVPVVPVGSFLAGAVPGRQPRAAAPGRVLQLTSGSTGEPRVVVQPVEHVLVGGQTYQQSLTVEPGQRVLAAVPLAHSFGLVGALATALCSGASLTLFETFTPRHVHEQLADCHVALGTPLVWELLARTGRQPAPGLRWALSSGGPLADDTRAVVRRRLDVELSEVYGSTETGIISLRDGHAPGTEGGVGHPVPGVDVRVAPDGAGPGSLWVRTPTTATGYLDGAGPVLDGEGFYDTGDLATLAPSGEIVLHGRKATFVNVGGRKVSPTRIERILGTNPSVADVAVYGVTTVAGEEEIATAVVVTDDLTAQDLVVWCRERLEAFEVPSRVHLLDALPRGGLGKVERSRLPH